MQRHRNTDSGTNWRTDDLLQHDSALQSIAR